MKIARLYNQHGAYCREWKGEQLFINERALRDGVVVLETTEEVGVGDYAVKPAVATMILNGHSLVIEEETEAG